MESFEKAQSHSTLTVRARQPVTLTNLYGCYHVSTRNLGPLVIGIPNQPHCTLQLLHEVEYLQQQQDSGLVMPCTRVSIMHILYLLRHMEPKSSVWSYGKSSLTMATQAGPICHHRVARSELGAH